MGWLTDLFKKQSDNPTTVQYADVLSGNAPIFSQYGTDLYSSDVVQQAINCIVSEMKKLRVTHIREGGYDVQPVNSTLQAVLNSPNPLMTTSEFLEKITWLLYLNANAFIIPIYYEWNDDKGIKRRRYEALYPISPNQVDFIEDSTGKLFVKFRFNNGESYTLDYNYVIHIKRNYSVNDYMGGNSFGQPDNRGLLQTININNQLMSNLSNAMRSSFAINGVVKFNTMLDDGKTEEALKRLEDKLRKSESGFLPLDLKAEYIPIKKEIQMVDNATLKFIDEKILRNFGVPLPILTGDFTKAQYSAFYQKTLEPLVISISQALTKSLFTDRELSFGNKIKLYPNEMVFMDIDQTLEMIRLLGDSGSLYENEKRVALGLQPLPELVGVRKQSLNYVDVNIVNEYQLSTVGGQSNEQITESV